MLQLANDERYPSPVITKAACIGGSLHSCIFVLGSSGPDPADIRWRGNADLPACGFTLDCTGWPGEYFNGKHDEEHVEQDLSDPRSGSSQPAESEDRGFVPKTAYGATRATEAFIQYLQGELNLAEWTMLP